MANELVRQLQTLKPGNHVCQIYETTMERLAVAIPFVQHGLEGGYRCLYVADGNVVRKFAKSLARAGVDVARHQQRGTLRR